MTGHDVAVASDGLVVTIADATEQLSWRWLRDHGEDPVSFDHQTRQRRIDVLNHDPAPATRAAFETVDTAAGSADALVIDWPDEPCSTWITTSTLESLIAGRGHATPASVATPWRDPSGIELQVLPVDRVLVDDEALASWLLDVATYGVGRLQGFDGSTQQAAALADRIGYVRESIFGGLWDLASDIDSHDDTAYTQSFLAPHTDGTYSHDAPGLQMFCCTERSGTGGESVIVDGLAIAEDLRRDHAQHFEVLTTTTVPAHYIEPGIELRASRPALVVEPRSGRLRQLSLNNYDRSPMLLPPDEMRAFYAAYGTLQRMADDRSRWLTIRMEAGDVLINDNWRVLHGRLAYTGDRRFVGCYLNHEDFESRCRTLGIPI